MKSLTRTVVERWPVIYLIAGPLWAIGIAGWVILPLARLQAERIKTCTSVTSGTVVAYDPSYHSSGIITYAVNGVTYDGAKISGMSAADVGRKVTIHYDPQNPTLWYPGEQTDFSWTGWIMGMASLVFGVSLMMVFAYLNAVRKIDLFSLPK
jgi:hypothetical protein